MTVKAHQPYQVNKFSTFLGVGRFESLTHGNHSFDERLFYLGPESLFPHPVSPRAPWEWLQQLTAGWWGVGQPVSIPPPFSAQVGVVAMRNGLMATTSFVY